MLQHTPLWSMVMLLCATAIAAITDARTGLIPNWLTLPALLGAPLVHALVAGPGALGSALCGGLSCGAVPLLLFRSRAIGGGDVKLFAVIGTLVGIRMGLELQLTSYGIAIAYALCWLTYRGELGAMLARSLRLLRLGLPSKAQGTPPEPDGLVEVRLGVPIFAASLLLVAHASLERWL
jgi:prepilin peptidase CpaA